MTLFQWTAGCTVVGSCLASHASASFCAVSCSGVGGLLLCAAPAQQEGVVRCTLVHRGVTICCLTIREQRCSSQCEFVFVWRSLFVVGWVLCRLEGGCAGRSSPGIYLVSLSPCSAVSAAQLLVPHPVLAKPLHCVGSSAEAVWSVGTSNHQASCLFVGTFCQTSATATCAVMTNCDLWCCACELFYQGLAWLVRYQHKVKMCSS